MSDKRLVKCQVGEKFSLYDLGNYNPMKGLSPSIVPLSPYCFAITLQGDWTRKDIRNFSNRLKFEVAEIDDILEFIISIDSCIETDIAFNAYISKGANDTYVPFGEDEGLGFHLFLVDENGIIKAMRLISLYPEISNDIVKILNRQLEIPTTREEHNKKVDKLYRDMTLKDVKANSFAHQNFFKSI